MLTADSPGNNLAIGLENTRDNYVSHFLRKLELDGFRLKLMVVGESGLGKTTLIDTLFRTNVKEKSEAQQAYLNAKTVTIEKRDVSITEGGVRLNLTVVDTPGYGDAINNEDAWQPVLDYIDVELETYMANSEDLSLRGKVPDTRVHACLYFMAPHRFKDVDLEFMKRLHTRVNLIPIIAKAPLLQFKCALQSTWECVPRAPDGRVCSMFFTRVRVTGGVFVCFNLTLILEYASA